MLVREIRFQKNKARLLSLARDFILLCERETHNPTCKDDLLKAITREINSCHDEISLWHDGIVDFNQIAIRMVSTNSFDLLASGEYHLAPGFVNPLGPTKNLFHVHSSALQWAKDHGLCNDDDIQEDREALRQAINSL